MTIEQVHTLDRKETKLVGFTVTASVNQDMEDGIVEKLRSELAGRRNEIIYQADQTGMYLVQIYPDGEWTPDVPFTDSNGHTVDEQYTVSIDLTDLDSNIGKELYSDGIHSIYVSGVDQTGQIDSGGYPQHIRGKRMTARDLVYFPFQTINHDERSALLHIE